MTITLVEVEEKLIAARLEFDRTGAAEDRETIVLLVEAREKLRQADARAFARRAIAQAEGELDAADDRKPIARLKAAGR